MSADFWGLKTAGGTATAYHLLAAMLAKSHALEVRLIRLMPYTCVGLEAIFYHGCAVRACSAHLGRSQEAGAGRAALLNPTRVPRTPEP